MNTLRIPLSSIPDDGLTIDATADAEAMCGANLPDAAVTPVRVRGHLTQLSARAYLFRGRITGAYKRPCDRCLVETESPFDIEVACNLEQGVTPAECEVWRTKEGRSGDAAEDVFCVEGGEIDLTPCICEEILLAAPTKSLCREDCAGLCPRCGANLNVEPCTCGVNNTNENRGLAGLADMFPDLRPDTSEE